MSSLAFSSEKVAGTCTRVNDGGFDDHSSILDEFLYVCAGVGVPDFGLLCGVEPDLTLADACDSGCEPLLRTKIDCTKFISLSNEKLGRGRSTDPSSMST